VLAPLLDEAIAPVRILRDDDERTALEAGLALQGLADQVVVLVLRRHAAAELSLYLGVEAARTDTKRDALTGTGEELPSILRDEDPGFADIF